MKIFWIKILVPLLYFLLAGFVFAGELYTRIYDRGNSEMSGLGTYLLTMPASSMVNWLFLNFGGLEKIGGSDVSFIIVLGLSMMTLLS